MNQRSLLSPRVKRARRVHLLFVIIASLAAFLQWMGSASAQPTLDWFAPTRDGKAIALYCRGTNCIQYQRAPAGFTFGGYDPQVGNEVVGYIDGHSTHYVDEWGFHWSAPLGTPVPLRQELHPAVQSANATMHALAPDDSGASPYAPTSATGRAIMFEWQYERHGWPWYLPRPTGSNSSTMNGPVAPKQRPSAISIIERAPTDADLRAYERTWLPSKTWNPVPYIVAAGYAAQDRSQRNGTAFGTETPPPMMDAQGHLVVYKPAGVLSEKSWFSRTMAGLVPNADRTADIHDAIYGGGSLYLQEHNLITRNGIIDQVLKYVSIPPCITLSNVTWIPDKVGQQISAWVDSPQTQTLRQSTPARHDIHDGELNPYNPFNWFRRQW